MSSITISKSIKNVWDGGEDVLPMNASYGKLMMWFFLLSDAFTFAGLLITYGFFRMKYPSFEGALESYAFSPDVWPLASKVFTHFPLLHGVEIPLGFVALMTLILISSSLTTVMAVEAGKKMNKGSVEKWMIATIVGGIIFLSCMGWEWSVFIEGINGVKATMSGNPYGPTIFANLFFIITGFHGLHVFSGIVLNIIVFYNVSIGTYERRGHYEMVEKVGLYWHFVDLVWVFVLTFLYLI